MRANAALATERALASDTLESERALAAARAASLVEEARERRERDEAREAQLREEVRPRAPKRPSVSHARHSVPREMSEEEQTRLDQSGAGLKLKGWVPLVSPPCAHCGAGLRLSTAGNVLLFLLPARLDSGWVGTGGEVSGGERASAVRGEASGSRHPGLAVLRHRALLGPPPITRWWGAQVGGHQEEEQARLEERLRDAERRADRLCEEHQLQVLSSLVTTSQLTAASTLEP